jgi:hypothetical protein
MQDFLQLARAYHCQQHPSAPAGTTCGADMGMFLLGLLKQSSGPQASSAFGKTTSGKLLDTCTSRHLVVLCEQCTRAAQC